MYQIEYMSKSLCK